ncbi:hypothetical protein [Shewanella nanhaiensis]|uniref:Uncharacterized protein n=1 Tax=Shewanella nanhaiensis TaxID=2864872 RepID=A0ABS7EA69_9GAMM|nr:hypothetical protein [Shewanella nanhaiensis]MBW8186573.1 hypothetical protein [Shewanella nanhaiensis]
MKPNKDGKYVFPATDFPSLFLPSVTSVAELLGLPKNLSQQITAFEQYFDKDFKISRSSKACLVTEGVGKPTVNKLVKVGSELSIPTSTLLSPIKLRKDRRALRLGSNAVDWLSLYAGTKCSKNDGEFTDFFKGMSHRAEADILMRKKLQTQIKLGELESTDISGVWLAQLPFWQQYSSIPNEQLATFTRYSEFSRAKLENIKTLPADYSLALGYMIFDFYLSAIACYEAALGAFYQRRFASLSTKNHLALYERVSETLSSDGDDYTCFGAMLLEVKRLISNERDDVSWRKLASFIPVDQVSQHGETLIDEQYHQLKDWKNGLNMPSMEKLERFVTAAFSYHGNYDVDAMLVYFRIAKVLDIKLNEFVAQVPNEHVTSTVETVLSSYPVYLEKYRLLLARSIG